MTAWLTVIGNALLLLLLFMKRKGAELNPKTVRALSLSREEMQSEKEIEVAIQTRDKEKLMAAMDRQHADIVALRIVRETDPSNKQNPPPGG